MQGILGIQREADRQALERDVMNMRGGVLREDPSLMQRIGSAVADYAVPDRYREAFNPSVMEPRLDMSKLEALRGTPVNMSDAPNPVPMLMDTMPMAGITAFHGSPHKFSKFDMSKIGTGEGGQAYGHGLYFAENPAVAKEYADELSRKINVGKNIIQGKGETIGTTGIKDVDDYLIADRGDASLALANMKTDRLEVANSSYPANAKSYDAGIEMLEGLVKRGEVQSTTDGNLYKVDIPDDQIAKMLDWDKPLSEQSSVMDFIEKNYRKANKPFEDSYASPDNRLFHPEDSTAFEFLQSFGSGNRAKASEMLKDHGIPGIKYLDQGSRGKYHIQLKYKGEPYGEPVELWAKNQVDDFVKEYQDKGFGTEVVDLGTRNFVMFDDQIPQILEINDKPLKGVLSGQ